MNKTAAICLIIILVCVCQVTQASKCRPFSRVLVRSNAWDTVKEESFIPISPNSNNLEEAEFEEVQVEPRLPPGIHVYCRINETGICPIYNQRSHIVGILISINLEDVKNVDPRDYNYSAVTEFTKTKICTTDGNITAYSITIHFYNPENVTALKAVNTPEVANGIWVYLNGKLFQADSCRPNSPRIGNFDLQGCLPRMGTRFFYKLNKHSKFPACKRGFFLILLYDIDGCLIGVAYTSPGSPPRRSTKDWYAHLNIEAVRQKNVIPNAPDCFFDLIAKYDLFSTHIFLVANPWEDSCRTCKC